MAKGSGLTLHPPGEWRRNPRKGTGWVGGDTFLGGTGGTGAWIKPLRGLLPVGVTLAGHFEVPKGSILTQKWVELEKRGPPGFEALVGGRLGIPQSYLHTKVLNLRVVLPHHLCTFRGATSFFTSKETPKNVVKKSRKNTEASSPCPNKKTWTIGSVRVVLTQRGMGWASGLGVGGAVAEGQGGLGGAGEAVVGQPHHRGLAYWGALFWTCEQIGPRLFEGGGFYTRTDPKRDVAQADLGVVPTQPVPTLDDGCGLWILK